MTLHSGGRRVRATLLLLLERDGPLCGRCAAPTIGTNGRLPSGPTIGHVVPVSKGGTDDLRNLRIEHLRCNVVAGARPDSPRGPLAVPLEIQ